MRLFPRPIALVPLALAAAVASPAAAQLRPLVSPPASRAEAARDGVEVFLVNEGSNAAPATPPDRIETIAQDGTPVALVPDAAADRAPVAAGGFVKLRYRLAPAGQQAPALAATAAPPAREEEASVTDSRGVSSGFFSRIRAYEPTYFALGDRAAGLKLQGSFAVRPFAAGLLKDLNVAYTQTAFWRVYDDSAPIESNIYRPEIFFERGVAEGLRVAVGYRHDSNGGGRADSYDLNRFFIRANQRFNLGGRWELNVAPEAWIFFGGRALAQDVDRFWGYGGINASLYQRDGWKFAFNGRGNPATGRGAAEMFISYPLKRLAGDAGVYLFVQGFTGFGEQLPRYNQVENRLRAGIAFTR
ncbi:phospholipase A [Sphingomonas sp.]|uniref:phospholipase A n=1 Tax=Sphingomonas sp. TaxID=28214 RepID=UPI001DCE441A|nr:phospholipase A [Sphingomonas sp.]MBX9797520.1 phospholipase A [Sphingomonas sp.]